jgi:hypothetical protein
VGILKVIRAIEEFLYEGMTWFWSISLRTYNSQLALAMSQQQLAGCFGEKTSI